MVLLKSSSRREFMSIFDWSLYPQAETFLQVEVAKFLGKNQAASKLAAIIEKNTSTSFFDWIDHIAVTSEETETNNLADMGFKESKEGHHPRRNNLPSAR